MKNKIKLWLVLPALFVATFYFADKALAQSEEPILIEIHDTDIGTTAFEQLIQYGNGGHAAMGALLGEAQNMETNPGIGFSIGSGGNGYRPSILIAVWTDQPFDSAAALATIKSHLNVPTAPVTTNGDCAIACDGTTQTVTAPVVEQSPPPAPVVESSPQPQTQTVSEPDPLPVNTSQEVTQPQPQTQPSNTQQYTPPTEVVDTNTAFSSSSFAPPQIDTSIISKTIITKTKITSKNIKSKKSKRVLTKTN